MALADYHSNSFIDPAGGGDFNIHDVGTSQRYAIGTRVTRVDGNQYVYVHAVSACAAGTPCGLPTRSSSAGCPALRAARREA